MELSRLCGQQIYIAIGDPNSNTLAEYKSEQNLDFEQYSNFEVFDNGDYEDLNSKYVNNKKYEEIQNKHRDQLESQKLTKQKNIPEYTMKKESDSLKDKKLIQFSKNSKSKKIQKPVLAVPKRKLSSDLPV